MPVRFEDENSFMQWNEAMAHKYDPEAYHLHSNFLIRWIERRRVRTILQFLRASQEDSVLEVGCGAGNVLAQVPSNYLHGMDLSVFLLKKAQRRLATSEAGLSQANAERLPFADGQFHKLICTEVLEHVANPRQVIEEMSRVARPEAVVVISIPNEVWIDRVKKFLKALGLARWLLEGHQNTYSSPEKMTDEWHLHSFDLVLLRQVTVNVLHLDEIRAIPHRFLPLRYVAKGLVIQQRTR